MSAFELGRSRMWPTQESTVKPLGRYCWIFFDFVGDSTMTSFLPAPPTAEDSCLAGGGTVGCGRAHDGSGAKGFRPEPRNAVHKRKPAQNAGDSGQAA